MDRDITVVSKERFCEALRENLEASSGDDSPLIRGAWELLAPPIPSDIERLLVIGGCLDAALALAEIMIGSACLYGWGISYTSAGGPYFGWLLLVPAADTNQLVEVRARSGISAACAVTAALLKSLDHCQ